LELLKLFKVPYDEPYIFEDLKWPNMYRAYGSRTAT
jgi:hypothetical protein